jgi:hypothetical protein
VKRAAALLACACVPGQAGAQAQPRPEAALRSYLQHQLGADGRDARYASALADLNGDRRPEAIVYLMSGTLCGTGGCVLLVLTPQGESWRQVGHLTVVNPPVRLLATRSHGWRDLGVHVAGGGARARDVRVMFSGRAYASNPSMLPTHRVGRPTPNRTLIIDDDPGRPLF